jgi:hypothetical protein
LVFATSLLATSVASSSEDPLFADTAIANVVIRAPMATLMRPDDDQAPVAGTIEIDQGPVTSMTCDPYGISRLRECELPSLHIRLDAGGDRDPVLADRDAVRLVTPCRMRGDHDRHIVLEYLIYASYATLTDLSLRTRLVRARFFDTEKADSQMTGYGFFIEDINALANRHGRQWLRTEPQRLSDLEAAQLTLTTLFQFMVGNTDWSAVRAHGTQLCCHNVAVLWGGEPQRGVPLPFDFDMSGLVDAPYAVPAPDLGIRSVTQRVYRGYCEHNPELGEAIDRFNRSRADIEALFARPDLPYPKSRERALRYIGDFYDIINDPKKLEKQIVRQCR